MATSIQAVTGLRSSCRVQGFPSTFPSACAGDSANLLRSQFFGCGRVHVPSAAITTKQAKRELTTIRSASFFEKLGQLFFPNPAEEEQVLAVYEINELDRGSPAFLRLTPRTDCPEPALGDLVPYSNKVYGPSGKNYLGLSAGFCIVIEHNPAGGDFYETTYTHYLGGYGQLSAMGPYYTYCDSEMVVTGGTGIFKGARGLVKICNVKAPLQLLYTYYITGIPKLPSELTSPVQPLEASVPAAAPVKVLT